MPKGRISVATGEIYTYEKGGRESNDTRGNLDGVLDRLEGLKERAEAESAKNTTYSNSVLGGKK